MKVEKITKSFTFTVNENNELVTTSSESLDHLEIPSRALSKVMDLMEKIFKHYDGEQRFYLHVQKSKERGVTP